MYSFDEFVGPYANQGGYPGATPEEHEVRVKSLKDKLRKSGNIPDELKELIVERVSTRDELLEIKRFERQVGTEYMTGTLGHKEWVIKDDSLKLVEILAGAALAIATVACVVGAAPGVAAVSLIFGCVALADRLKRKSASLTEEQFHILMTLKALGPSTSKELATRLGSLHIFGKDNGLGSAQVGSTW
jgi:Flp pilus assembly protein TadB